MSERQGNKKRISGYMPVIAVFLFVGLWYIIAAVIGKGVILPMPHKVFTEIAAMLTESAFYISLLNSLWKIALSFIIALAFGLGLAALAANAFWLERLLYPLIIVARSTPTMSVIFLAILWFGASLSPIIVSLLVIFPLTYSSSITAIKSVDKNLIEMSALYNVSRSTIAKKLYIPFVADRVYSDSVSILSLNVKLIIAAEALAMSNMTLGRIMQVANENLETARLFAVTLFAVLISVLLELALKFIRSSYRRKKYGKA